MQACAACHGWQGPDGYVFEGAKIGTVEPIDHLRTDPNRLNSYTQQFRNWQISAMFAGTPYHFTHFVKTDGYANVPLDGLWLRAPYLHNGSVPTLADLLEPPDRRPKQFVRGSDVIDPVKGGFQAPPVRRPRRPDVFCFDTSRARQQRRRPRVWNGPARRAEAGSAGLSPDVLTGGGHDRRPDAWLERGSRAEGRKSVYQKTLGFNMLLHLLIGLGCMFAPDLVSQTFGLPSPVPTGSIRGWGATLILVTALYIPGLQDPLRSRAANIIGILGRIWMATVWFCVWGFAGERGFFWFGLFDLSFAVILAWLYYRYCVAELISRP